MISNRISSFILVATYRVADFRVFFYFLLSLRPFFLFCFVLFFFVFFCPLSPNSFLASCLSGLECRRGAISTSLQNGCVALFFFELSSRAASLRRHLSFLLHVFKKNNAAAASNLEMQQGPRQHRDICVQLVFFFFNRHSFVGFLRLSPSET